MRVSRLDSKCVELHTVKIEVIEIVITVCAQRDSDEN